MRAISSLEHRRAPVRRRLDAFLTPIMRVVHAADPAQGRACSIASSSSGESCCSHDQEEMDLA